MLLPWLRRGRHHLGVVLAVAGALVMLGVAASPASAHAFLVSSDPAEGAVLAESPDRIVLTFNEPVSLAADAARLYDAGGEEVAAEATSVDEQVTVEPTGELADGTYVLTYRVISADSHPVAGSLSFSVGSPSETVVSPDAAGADRGVDLVHGFVQALTYLALFLAAGLALFLVWFLPENDFLHETRRRIRRLALVGSVVAVAGAVALVPVTVVYQQGLGLAGLGDRLAWTGWLSTDGLLAALVAAGLAVALAGVTGRRTPRARAVSVSAGVAVALGSLPLVGHTRSYGPAWLVITTDVLHVTAAAVWFGGVVGLALSLPVASKRGPVAASVVGRFSTVAGGLIALIAVAGLVLGWRILGSWPALLSTSYGLVLLSKTAAVSVVVAVASWNRFRLVPRVVAATGYSDRLAAGARVRTAVRLEAVGLVGVLLLTGFLVNRVPTEEQASTTADSSTVTARADDLQVVAHLDPGMVGSNQVVVQVQDGAGEPFDPVALPVVSVRSAGTDLGSRPVRNVDVGTYQAEVVIPTAGVWEIQVSVRTGDFENPVLTLETVVVP